MRLLSGMILAGCHRLSLPEGRGSPQDAARERKRRATVPKSDGYHNRAPRRIEVELRRSTSSRCGRFLRSASGRPCGAKDPLGRRASPLTPVGPRRLQATRAEGWRRGCRLILGDRRSEFRPHFAADSHDNGHNNGGEHQAHQTSHKSAHRHSDIPKPANTRTLLIAHRGGARFVSTRQKGHVVAERRHRHPSRNGGRPTSERLQPGSIKCTTKRHSH